MRDVALARRQLLTAGLCVLASIGVLVFMILPQYRAWQSHQLEVKQGVLPNAFEGIPRLLTAKGNKLETEKLQAALKVLIEKNGCDVLSINQHPEKSEVVSEKLSIIKRMPVQIKFQGPFLSIQDCLKQILSQYPGAALQMVQLKALEEQTFSVGESPNVIATVDLTVFVVAIH